LTIEEGFILLAYWNDLDNQKTGDASETQPIIIRNSRELLLMNDGELCEFQLELSGDSLVFRQFCAC